MEELPLDMYPIMFSYLTQMELSNMLLTNKFIYSQLIKYINTTDFIVINHKYQLRKACENDLIISVLKLNPKLYWGVEFIYMCDTFDYRNKKIHKMNKESNSAIYQKIAQNACQYGSSIFAINIIEKMYNRDDLIIDITLGIIICLSNKRDIIKYIRKFDNLNCLCKEIYGNTYKNVCNIYKFNNQ